MMACLMLLLLFLIQPMGPLTLLQAIPSWTIDFADLNVTDNTLDRDSGPGLKYRDICWEGAFSNSENNCGDRLFMRGLVLGIVIHKLKTPVKRTCFNRYWAIVEEQEIRQFIEATHTSVETLVQNKSETSDRCDVSRQPLYSYSSLGAFELGITWHVSLRSGSSP